MYGATLQYHDLRGSLKHVARAWSPITGILMDVMTTMSGVQFYTGNFLDGCPAGKGQAPYENFWGFCLETQYFPDSPHHPQFPAAILRAGEAYKSQTVYQFKCLASPNGKFFTPIGVSPSPPNEQRSFFMPFRRDW